jgi:nucleotide-binding universal stress UspA family protein
MTKTILVATDESRHARKALECACNIALHNAAMVYILHVFSLGPLASRWVPSLTSTELQSFVAWRREQARRILWESERIARERGIKNVRTIFLEGIPDDAILQFAEKHAVDLIFTGNHGPGRLETLLVGSVSHKVKHFAPCTCITVKQGSKA